MQKLSVILFILLTNFVFAQQTSTIIRFAAFQAQLDAQAQQQIETLINQFDSNEELQIDIYSFTDDNEAKKQGNKLSEKRNEVVLNYLLQKNYKIKATHTFIGGKLLGEVPNDSDEERAQNRRTLLIVNKIVKVQPKYYRYEREIGLIPSAPKTTAVPEIFALKLESEKEGDKTLPNLPE